MTRGRFAPSPTGALHVGNARSALLAWLHARAAGGRFVMRVEDLDFGRVRPGYMERQLDELHWLGLDWDEGPDVGGPHAPYVQSQRQPLYEAALRRLAEMGMLFACTCSRRDIAGAASAPHVGEEGPRYPGTCRDRRVQAGPGSLTDFGRSQFALRVAAPSGPIPFTDELLGPCAFDPADEGDFVVRRKDGVAAYQLAVVVDDAAMRITDVVRGADLLSSTARQILLYRALELPEPRFLHVPLMLGPDGERLAKRHGAVSLGELRDAGVPADAVAGWLASTCGLAEPGERLHPSRLIERFNVARLPVEPTVVTEADLRLLRSTDAVFRPDGA
ncbi:tRNA glutamyl-Q(34) synthetase GluQRS [Longimicrobium terrae]|uniref:Glutamyl-Q tRNA(Asp) synthetase n=1 Tax=Longimicrobium terrae TaxID=1639882 RepID=A0A841GZV3_9BACT|nr:tRNA glutamyl-Q(34) synthetase GluQRS [Longimicrobium terrae]MBB4636701.1 glutamyl-tRNA synthetase [Longimicrobium terrae]MBB6071300.1 glutamyl-tRNA synthetase [Longimicrobium terrae]NNC29344.1 tRNA glutamyl-Q(34) synthetase GluQRS [Longimicrobium terrae]